MKSAKKEVETGNRSLSRRESIKWSILYKMEHIIHIYYGSYFTFYDK